MYLLFVCNYLKFHGLKTNDTYTNSNINSHAAITLQKMRKYPETDFSDDQRKRKVIWRFLKNQRN